MYTSAGTPRKDHVSQDEDQMVVQCIELVSISGPESDLPLIRGFRSGVRSMGRQGWTERARNEDEEILVSGLVVEI
jgi:hypothetical protein